MGARPWNLCFVRIQSIHFPEPDYKALPPILDVEHRFRLPPPHVHEDPQTLQHALGG